MIADSTNSYELSEHAKINNVHGKKVFVVGSTGYVADVDSSGNLKVNASVSVDEFATNDIEEASTTVTYIGTENSAGVWYLKKIDTTSAVVFGHASVANNPLVTNYSDAWTNRATLTYGDYSSAF